MLPSIELRWFKDGPLPESVVDWYEEAVGLARWNERTDRYVHPVGPAGLNVKWREGNIVIKRLVDVVGEMAWGEVSGVVERWRKWSMPLAEEMPLAATGKDWILVTKHRTVRTLTVREDKLVLTKPGEQFPHGCHVEIAGLKCRKRDWWTVTLEGFGPDAEARDMLDRTAKRIFSEEGRPNLRPEHSMSYVKWLWGME